MTHDSFELLAQLIGALKAFVWRLAQRTQHGAIELRRDGGLGEARRWFRLLGDMRREQQQSALNVVERAASSEREVEHEGHRVQVSAVIDTPRQGAFKADVPERADDGPRGGRNGQRIWPERLCARHGARHAKVEQLQHPIASGAVA